nr:glycerate kinase [Palleronia pontilimi]
MTGLFDAAVGAADPARAIARAMPDPPKGRTVVVGCGKGAAQLAAAFDEAWAGDLSGVVVTRYGYATDAGRIRVLEAAHPVPDAAGLKASRALLDAVSGLGEDDLVVALICGGGSALLPMPPEGLDLDDERALNEALLSSGAPIGVMNAIRTHVSGIKGGRLAAAAHPARVVTLVVSDVPGDDPAQVASGPTVPSGVGLDETRALIRNHGIALPERVQRHLDSQPPDAPMPDDPGFARDRVQVIASAGMSLDAARRHALDAGVPAVILSDAVEGEARDVGRVLGALAREVALRDRPFAAPMVLLSGGETTVTLKGKDGRGGRNTELLLSLSGAIDGLTTVFALAADTDGIDGSEDNAGAFVTGDTRARMRAAGVDPDDALARNDAWGAFDAIGDLFVPGPTGTNVNDFRAILIRPGQAEKAPR